jgi:large subunit ribosomal protein L30e
MVDVNKSIRMAVKTGKVEYGSKNTLASASQAKAKLVILANNCPLEQRETILYNAEQGEVPVYVFQGSSLDLGALCEKPFPIAAMVIKEPGDSEVLKLAESK